MLARANVSCCVPTPVSYRRLPTQPANGAGQARGGGDVTFRWGSVEHSSTGDYSGGSTGPTGTDKRSPFNYLKHR